VSAIAFLRIPSMKVAVIVLSLFFLYDIFWVFISPFIFKKSVMESVALGLPTLPMVFILPRTLEPDRYSLLGVGDMVLPGLFLCFLYRFDKHQHIPFVRGYFALAWLGYALGLYVCFIVLVLMQRGQPALLYLVPFTIFPTAYLAWRRSQLQTIWQGIKETPPDRTIATQSNDDDDDDDPAARLLGSDSNVNSHIETPFSSTALPRESSVAV